MHYREFSFRSRKFARRLATEALSFAVLSVTTMYVMPSVARADTTEGLQEIVVTAERREESLQKVPASITVFTGARLEESNVQDLQAYFLQTPNVNFQEEGRSGPRSVDIAIRGVSNIGGKVNAFGVYLDEFNIANIAQEGAVNPLLQDIERIEVLRGPQGTFFGRNATGGALNITTNQPGPELESQIQIRYGRYNTWGATAIVNAPIVDNKLFVRAMVDYDASDGFVKNVNPAGGRSDYQTSNIKLATRWLASERLTVDVAGYFTHENSGLSPLVPTGVLNADTQSITGTPVPVSDGLGFFPSNTTLVNHDLSESQKNETDIATMRLRYQADGFEIHSITGIISTERQYLDDLDFTSQSLITQQIHDTAQTWSEEVRIQSTQDGPWIWTIGTLYAEDIKNVHHEVRAGSDMFFGLPNHFPIDIVEEANRTKSWAVFGQSTWHMLDKLSLTGGGRYSHDKVEEVAGGIDFGTPKRHNVGATTFSDFSPRLALSYDLADKITTYAAASKGYKAGGLQFNAALPEQSFAKETLWNYEVGIRSFLFDQKLMLNATVFYMKWKDLQVESFATLTDPVTHVITLVDTTDNAAVATSKGVELEFAARPIRPLQFDGSVGFLRAKFDEFPNANITGMKVDLSGKDLIRAPKLTLNADAEYDFALANFIGPEVDEYVRGEWSYRSRTKPNTPAIIQEGFPNDIPSFAVANFRTGVKTKSWRVEGFVENAFNKNYFTGQSGFGFGGIRVRPHPRTWGLRVTLNIR